MVYKILELKGKLDNSIKSFQECSEFLLEGTYIISDDFKCFYMNDFESKNYARNILRKGKISKKRFLKYIILYCIRTKRIKLKSENKSKFAGSIFLYSNSTDDKNQNLSVKIFNLTNNEVLTIYKDSTEMELHLANYECFKEYFSMPQIRKFDYGSNALVESLIVSKPKKIWDDKEYKSFIVRIFGIYYKYYKNRAVYDEKKYLSINSLLGKQTNNVGLERIKDNIKSVLKEKELYFHFPVVKQHGDLSLNNILVEKKSCDLYFIDWEHSAEFFFLYDVFWLIQNEAAYSSNYMYLDAYLNGEYDHYFIEIFNLYSLQFDKKSRGLYYLIFILELIKCRLANKSNSIKSEAALIIEPIASKIIENLSYGR